jgi:hypothetical protein
VAASAAVGLGWRGAVGLGVPLAFTVAWMMLRLPPSAWLDGGRWASGFRPRGAPTIGRITARGGRASTEAEAATDDPDPRGGAVVDDPRGGAVVDGPASGEVPFRSRGVFAVFVGVTALASMVELSAVFWGAQLLVDVAGATPGTAAAALTAFIAGITAGRVATARLAVRRSALGLLIVGVGLVAAGWALLWLGTSLTVGVIGLFTMGCGVGPGYPLGTHLSLRHSPRGLDSSQAMVLLATGTGGSLAPFALGWLADRVGVHTAYTVVPSLLAVQFTAIAVGAVILARRRRTLREP